ncbi:hypothetical protein CLF_110766 [Clonorchis sinensis]|uniref:Uncharacterized protein n=1 Tax=Clonorchis sinensis TaxID=79923 RepID=G7YTV5_CLOSI|nr:hypothetical protein CLF_110766 [Clonorchis sinensis]
MPANRKQIRRANYAAIQTLHHQRRKDAASAVPDGSWKDLYKEKLEAAMVELGRVGMKKDARKTKAMVNLGDKKYRATAVSVEPLCFAEKLITSLGPTDTVTYLGISFTFIGKGVFNRRQHLLKLLDEGCKGTRKMSLSPGITVFDELRAPTWTFFIKPDLMAVRWYSSLISVVLGYKHSGRRMNDREDLRCALIGPTTPNDCMHVDEVDRVPRSSPKSQGETNLGKRSFPEAAEIYGYLEYGSETWSLRTSKNLQYLTIDFFEALPESGRNTGALFKQADMSGSKVPALFSSAVSATVDDDGDNDNDVGVEQEYRTAAAVKEIFGNSPCEPVSVQKSKARKFMLAFDNGGVEMRYKRSDASAKHNPGQLSFYLTKDIIKTGEFATLARIVLVCSHAKYLLGTVIAGTVLAPLTAAITVAHYMERIHHTFALFLLINILHSSVSKLRLRTTRSKCGYNAAKRTLPTSGLSSLNLTKDLTI